MRISRKSLLPRKKPPMPESKVPELLEGALKFGIKPGLERITTLYEEVAAAFCAKCGAHPVMMTRGYILPLCEKCWEKWKEHSLSEDIREFKPEFPVVTSSRTENGVTVEAGASVITKESQIFDNAGSNTLSILRSV